MKNFYNGKPCGCNSPSDSYYRAPNMTTKFKRLLCVSPEYADSINDLDTLLCGKFLPIRGGAHDRFKTYEDFTIVYDAETLVAYLSKKEVPYGVEITNREYWQPMNITGYADDNVIILNDKNVSGLIIPYTLETATKSIAEVARKQGKVLMFFSLEGGAHWEMWQFFGLDVSDWEDVSQWRSIYNVWNKFVGWYDTTELLYQLQVYPIDGKYAIVGPTIRDAVIYEGTPGGWIPLDVNLYQKFLNDFLELIDEGVIVLTECQKEILKEWLKEIGIGCDCEDGADVWKTAWGSIDRPYTTFLITTDFTSEETFKFTYPTSIFHDNSDEESVGQPALHSITLNGTGSTPIKLGFTAGTWNSIFTHVDTIYPPLPPPDVEIIGEGSSGPTEPYTEEVIGEGSNENQYSTDNIRTVYTYYKDEQFKEDAGYMYIHLSDIPHGLQYTLKRTYKGTVTDNGRNVRPFVNDLATPCDGADYEIHLMKPNTVKVQLNYYNSATSMIKTKTIEVPYGSTMQEPTITDATYAGHTFVGWATNYSLSSDSNNYFDVVNRTSEGPSYFDFDTELTEDLALYAWYNITATFEWTDNNGSHSENRDVAYHSNVTNAPTVGPLTGYTFQGWQFNTATIPAGQPVGPIVKPVIINGLYNPAVVRYNYKVVNSTGYPITVTVGGQQESIPVGGNKTITLEGSGYATAVVTVLTPVPTAANTNYAWTINSTEGNTKTVSNGAVTIGLNTTYNYKINNNSSVSPISVTVGSQTKNVTTSNTFVVPSNSNTVTVNTAAPEGYLWVINSTTGASLENVAPGTIAISLEVDPSVHRSENVEPETGWANPSFTWDTSISKYIAADFRHSDLQLALDGWFDFASDDILSAEFSYDATPNIKFYLELPADYGGSGLILDHEVTDQITCTPDRARLLINSHVVIDDLPPVGNNFEFTDYYLPYTLDLPYAQQISKVGFELFYNLDLSRLTAPAGHTLDEYNLVCMVDGEYYYTWSSAYCSIVGYNYLKED